MLNKIRQEVRDELNATKILMKDEKSNEQKLKYEGTISGLENMLDILDTDQCRVCGCTEQQACEGGCSWAVKDGINSLCSECCKGDRRDYHLYVPKEEIIRIKKMLDENKEMLGIHLPFHSDKHEVGL